VRTGKGRTVGTWYVANEEPLALVVLGVSIADSTDTAISLVVVIGVGVFVASLIWRHRSDARRFERSCWRRCDATAHA
jgi:hypothetical protein